jgi:hypothetical protein
VQLVLLPWRFQGWVVCGRGVGASGEGGRFAGGGGRATGVLLRAGIYGRWLFGGLAMVGIMPRKGHPGSHGWCR